MYEEERYICSRINLVYLFVYPYQWYQISLLVSCMMMLLLGDVILFVLMVWIGAVESSKGTLSYFRSICQSCQGCCVCAMAYYILVIAH